MARPRKRSQEDLLLLALLFLGLAPVAAALLIAATTVVLAVAIADQTAPVITGTRSPPPRAHGWNNSDVTVQFACADVGSDAPGLAVNTVAGRTLSNEGAGQSVTNSGTCTDNTGNTGRSATIGDINIDKTAPEVTARRTPAPNSNGWNATEVVVAASGKDALSGLDGCTTVTISREGAGQTATVRCTDRAGNSAAFTVSGINIDTTPPEVTAQQRPAPNSGGWNNSDVTVAASGKDALSGLDDCTAVTVSREGANQMVTVRCSDKAGNSTSVLTTVNIDKTAPTVARLTPDDGAKGVPLTETVTATFSEPIDSATLTGATFMLTARQNTLKVEAAVTYDPVTRTAELKPSRPLLQGTTYTATVIGGAGGVRDLAGNPLAANKVWTFTSPPIG